MKQNWLWDRKINLSEARKILKHSEDSRFILIASLLLARKADPGEVFKDYIAPDVFCRNWQRIKKNMRHDKWGKSRVVFWQAIYDKLLEKYRKKGMQILREKNMEVRDPVCDAIGKEIRRVRKEEGLSQEQLAEKVGISQQLISRIEKGKENMSLLTLKKIARALARKVEISFPSSL